MPTHSPGPNLRETLRTRAEWENPGAGCLRWLITLACLFTGPILMGTVPPSIGIPLVAAVLLFWIWWSLPFIGFRSSILNLPIVLAGILINLAAIATMAKR